MLHLLLRVSVAILYPYGGTLAASKHTSKLVRNLLSLNYKESGTRCHTHGHILLFESSTNLSEYLINQLWCLGTFPQHNIKPVAEKKKKRGIIPVPPTALTTFQSPKLDRTIPTNKSFDLIVLVKKSPNVIPPKNPK